MFDYTGYQCKSCGGKFEEGDDIVVCPDCGTPYHRSCWKENGKCINEELHENGKSWKADMEERVESGEIARCKCCGNTLDPKQLFCDRCGAPTQYYFRTNTQPYSGDPNASGQPEKQGQTGQQGQPGQYSQYYGQQGQYGQPGQFSQQMSETMHPYMINFSDPLCGFSPDEEYEQGVTTKDLGEFIGSNTHYYLPKFKLMKTGHFKMSLNFVALFFPEFYFANRKMPVAALLALIIRTVIGLPSMALGLQASLGDKHFYEMFMASMPMLTEQAKHFMELNLGTAMFTSICNVTYIISNIFTLGLGFFANYIYYRHALKTSARIKKYYPESFGHILRECGGTSVVMTLVFIALYCVFSVGSMIAVMYLL